MCNTFPTTLLLFLEFFGPNKVPPNDDTQFIMFQELHAVHPLAIFHSLGLGSRGKSGEDWICNNAGNCISHGAICSFQKSPTAKFATVWLLELGADRDTSDATAFIAFKTELVELVAISSVEFGRGDCTSTSSTSLLWRMNGHICRGCSCLITRAWRSCSSHVTLLSCGCSCFVRNQCCWNTRVRHEYFLLWYALGNSNWLFHQAHSNTYLGRSIMCTFLYSDNFTI